jgi:molybdate transport system substrate-binding protein
MVRLLPALGSAIAAVTALAWLGPATAQPGAQNLPLRALSSNGVRVAVESVLPGCERSVGRAVEVQYGTSASIRQRIAGGERVDVAFITAGVVADLAQEGHLVAGSVAPLGRAGIGVGVRLGGRQFDIGSAATLKQTFLEAESVTFAREGASRRYIESMFEQLGIAAEMQAKTLLEPGSVQAAEKVAAGEAEILLTLVSEILPEDGMHLLGPLPAEFQSYIAFDAVLGAQASDAAAARALVACLAAPAATPAFASKGLQR